MTPHMLVWQRGLFELRELQEGGLIRRDTCPQGVLVFFPPQIRWVRYAESRGLVSRQSSTFV